MQLTVEIIRDGAYDLLSGMERLNLIRLNSPVKKEPVSGKKLSQQFAGALRLSDSAYEAYQKAIHEGRKEWCKDITDIKLFNPWQT